MQGTFRVSFLGQRTNNIADSEADGVSQANIYCDTFERVLDCFATRGCSIDSAFNWHWTRDVFEKVHILKHLTSGVADGAAVAHALARVIPSKLAIDSCCMISRDSSH